MTGCKGSAETAVVVCADAKGLPYAAFTASVLARLFPDRGYDICIGGPDEITLPDWLTALGVSFVPLRPGKGAEVVQRAGAGHLPASAYLKLWLPEALKHRFQRVLYLDYDIFPRGGEVERLLQSDMLGYPVAAVRDLKQWRKLGRPVFEFQANGLGGLPYLNSGVLLIDTDRWLSEHITQRCVAIAAAKPKMFTHDQGLLNLVLKGGWAEMSPSWNWHMTREHHLLYDLLGVNMLHYAGLQKPWSSGAAQLKQDARSVQDYVAFLQRYFPDCAVPITPRTWRNRKLRQVPETVLETLRILPFLRRFRSELTLLRPLGSNVQVIDPPALVCDGLGRVGHRNSV